jgi:hypothetical protein
VKLGMLIHEAYGDSQLDGMMRYDPSCIATQSVECMISM